MEALLSAYRKLISEGRTLRLQAGKMTWRLICLLGLGGVLEAGTLDSRDLAGAGEVERRHEQSPVRVGE
jgi:hypothetical protein